ncbi:MAG: hypothetical protein RBT65_12430 [Methanolobus sp.]|nr:hypothetical protein [Methanolobus sp.]
MILIHGDSDGVCSGAKITKESFEAFLHELDKVIGEEKPKVKVD